MGWRDRIACRFRLDVSPPHRTPGRSVVIVAGTMFLLAMQSRVDAAGFGPATLQTPQNIVVVSAFVGVTLLAAIVAMLHVTSRQRWVKRERALQGEADDLRARLDRAQVFLSAEPQIVIAWGATNGEPDIEGDFSLVSDAPIPRRILGFGAWLPPASAQEMDHKVERLRSRGERFRLPLTSVSGRHLEAEGRAVNGRAVLRLREVSGDRLALRRLVEEHDKLRVENNVLRTMLDSIPNPVWRRDAAGDLAWVNEAYVRAVEAKNADDVVARRLELLDEPARHAAMQARQEGAVWRSRVAAVVSGERHAMAIIDVPAQGGSVAIGTDLAELEAARADLERQIESHRTTLDKLPTGVAIFDAGKRLVFNNAAYRQMWSLDQSYLDQKPTDGEVLDRMRAQRCLPEQADFRTWKTVFLAGYQAVEPTDDVWHLPDGRAVRYVINPNPQGGVTYLFDDISRSFNLESENVSLHRIQSETLDTLKEGVAVFGSDGRIRLFNPAFVALWKLDTASMHAIPAPHVDEIARRCAPLYPDAQAWQEVRSTVTGLHDVRDPVSRRYERRDGVVVDFAAAPLPDGATLLTFADITDGANVEKVLTERNVALMQMEKLRNEFVQKVSYELRTPLTNIIGFTDILADPAFGPLTTKQAEYAGYIQKSSMALLAITNNILDLATIDAGAMELSLSEVDIARTIAAAAEGLNDRLEADGLQLNILMLDDIGTFVADDKRVLQILFNLLSNAIGASTRNQTIALAALRRDTDVVFKVTDQGRAIPAEVIERILHRDRGELTGAAHSGIELGLSIVRSFVELHGGRMLIDSVAGEGTTVTCILPARHDEAVARPPVQAPVEPAAPIRTKDS